MRAHFCALSPRRCEIFPLRLGRGGEPVGEGSEQNAGAFFGKVGFSRKSGGEKRKTAGFSHGLGRRAHGLGAGLAPNGGRRADGRLRKGSTGGADGRRGALSEGHALYIMCLAAQNCSDSRRLPKKPPPATKRSAVGALLWGCVGTEGAGFSVCRRAYRLFSWGYGRRPVLFRLSVRAFRPVQRGLRERGPRRAQLPREPAPPSPGGRSGS